MGRLETFLEEGNGEPSLDFSRISTRRRIANGESFYSNATGALEEGNEEQSIEPSLLSRRRIANGESFYSSRSRSQTSSSFPNIGVNFNESISYASFAGHASFASPPSQPNSPTTIKRPSIFTTASGRRFYVDGSKPPVPVMPEDTLEMEVEWGDGSGIAPPDSLSKVQTQAQNRSSSLPKPHHNDGPFENASHRPMDQYQSQSSPRDLSDNNGWLQNKIDEEELLPDLKPSATKQQQYHQKKQQQQQNFDFRSHTIASPIMEETGYNDSRRRNERGNSTDYHWPHNSPGPPPQPRLRLVEPLASTASKTIRRPLIYEKEPVQLVCSGSLPPRPHETAVTCRICRTVLSVPKLTVMVRCNSCSAVSPASHHLEPTNYTQTSTTDSSYFH